MKRKALLCLGVFQLCVTGHPSVLAAVPKQNPTQASASTDGAVEIVHTPLLRSSLTLTGQRSTAELAIQLDPLSQGRSAPHLILQWDVSAIVDLGLSTLTVELDEIPIASIKLDKSQPKRTLDLSLSGTSGGFHVVRVRAHLLTGPDPSSH